jgi:hypothetical protein
VALADVVVEVFRLLGTPGEGRHLTLQARGHEVNLAVAHVDVRPPSPDAWVAGPGTPGSSAWRSLTEWPSLAAWQSAWASIPEWPSLPEWPSFREWPSFPEAAGWGMPALGRVSLALRDVAVDDRAPFEVLDITADAVSVDLGNPPTLVARGLVFEVAASSRALGAWLPDGIVISLRPDGRLGLTRSGWGRWAEVPVAVTVVDGTAHVDADAVVVRGRRLPAPRRWHQHRELDPATYHPGLRFESVEVDAPADRVRARLSLAEWREPVSLGQLLDLRGRLGRHAPVVHRSLVGA